MDYRVGGYDMDYRGVGGNDMDYRGDGYDITGGTGMTWITGRTGMTWITGGGWV